jgi:hypothetical protein
VFFVLGNRGWVLRVAAVVYSINALLSVIGGGWHSVSWIGWSAMALGFLALSFAEDESQPGKFRWRSPVWVVGLGATALGLGLLVSGLFHWRPF